MQHNISIEEEDEKSIVYNNSDFLFMEEEYFQSVSNFISILDKMYIKRFDGALKYISKAGTIATLENTDYSIYNEIVSDNNIDISNKQRIKISIQILSYFSESDTVKKIKNIYILLFLSNVTNYKDNIFDFQIKSDNNLFKFTINYEDDMNFDLTNVYNWIIENQKHTNVYKIKLGIIRNVISKDKKYNLSSKDLLNCDSIFNRIIHGEVSDYFEQVNLLKNDFIKLEESKNKIQHSLHLKLLTWLSAIGIAIFDAIKDSKNTNLAHLIIFSHTEKVQIILVILACALIIIFIIYYVEFYQHINEYKRIEKFYIDKLHFIGEDFKYYIKKPRIQFAYILLFLIFLFIIVCRFFI
ncbi:hypothetical protein [Amedibacillus sp. YH-ame10]